MQKTHHVLPDTFFPVQIFITFQKKKKKEKSILKTTYLALSLPAINFKEGCSILTRTLNVLIFEEGKKSMTLIIQVLVGMLTA